MLAEVTTPLRYEARPLALTGRRTRHSRINCKFPGDFPQRLERFREASGMALAELSRRPGAHPHTVRRWRNDGVRPGTKHLMAPLNLAGSLGLARLLTGRSCQRDAERDGSSARGGLGKP